MADNKQTKNGFTVSELPSIENIDGNDLLLVSDKENGKYYTKKMTIEQLSQKIAELISSSPVIMDQLKQKAADVAEDVAGDVSASHVHDVIQQNPAIVLDILDGIPDGQLIMGDDD